MVNNDGDKAAFISERDEAMEVDKESSECGFPVHGCYEFSIKTCNINV